VGTLVERQGKFDDALGGTNEIGKPARRTCVRSLLSVGADRSTDPPLGLARLTSSVNPGWARLRTSRRMVLSPKGLREIGSTIGKSFQSAA
jgi:hypothetical protein